MCNALVVMGPKQVQSRGMSSTRAKCYLLRSVVNSGNIPILQYVEMINTSKSRADVSKAAVPVAFQVNGTDLGNGATMPLTHPHPHQAPFRRTPDP